jgi:Spy/CpxP family protein refolding chaperone
MKAAAKAITVVALVFIVGFLSGIGAIACFQAISSDRPWQDTRFLPRQFTRFTPKPGERIEQFARELELTPGQREQFEPVLRAGMEKIRDVRQKHRPEVRAVLLETRMALRSILNEHQCKRFDELSLPMIPGRDFPGDGRCLQDAPEGEHWRGAGRKRRMGRQETLEHSPYVK